MTRAILHSWGLLEMTASHEKSHATVRTSRISRPRRRSSGIHVGWAGKNPQQTHSCAEMTQYRHVTREGTD